MNRTNEAHKSALIRLRRDAFVWSLVYQEQGKAVCDWNKRGSAARSSGDLVTASTRTPARSTHRRVVFLAVLLALLVQTCLLDPHQPWLPSPVVLSKENAPSRN